MCRNCLPSGEDGPDGHSSRLRNHLAVTNELAEYLCQVATLLPFNCPDDVDGCDSEECPACHAFALCRKFREFEGVSAEGEFQKKPPEIEGSPTK